MAFLDELREKVNTPIVGDINSKATALAEAMYQEEVVKRVEVIKIMLREKVQQYRESRENSGEKIFRVECPFSYSSYWSDHRYVTWHNNSDFVCAYERAVRMRISPELKREIGNKVEEDAIYRVDYEDIDSNSEREIFLKGLYTIEKYKHHSIFWGDSYTVRIELTELGKRFYEDIKGMCKKEGISISGLYGRSGEFYLNREEEFTFEIGKSVRLETSYCHLCFYATVKL